MALLTLSEIAVYPLKSGRGLSPDEANVTPKGFDFDRQWMLVTPAGTMHSQRTLPAMATLETELTERECIIRLPNGESIHLPLSGVQGAPKAVELWGQPIDALHLDQNYDRLLSEFLGTACELVYLPHSSARPLDPDYAEGATVGFSDGFPFLVATTASLTQLNEKLETPIPINRFRANLIIDGADPFAEDRWKTIKIGPAIFSLVKPCTRCTIITTDQQTGERNSEPLKALNEFRMLKSPKINGVIFGENAITDYSGSLKVGMPVEILEEES